MLEHEGCSRDAPSRYGWPGQPGHWIHWNTKKGWLLVLGALGQWKNVDNTWKIPHTCRLERGKCIYTWYFPLCLITGGYPKKESGVTKMAMNSLIHFDPRNSKPFGVASLHFQFSSGASVFDRVAMTHQVSKFWPWLMTMFQGKIS